MITRLNVRNFKSWRATGDARLASLTVLFGANSSGKTSLLQLLLMLKQTADSPDRGQVLNLGGDRSLVELGAFQDVLFGHDSKLSLAWDIDWTLPDPMPVEDPTAQGAILFRGDSLGFSASIASNRAGKPTLGGAAVDCMAYRFAGGEFGMRVRPGSKREYELYGTYPGFKFLRTPGRPWNLPPPVKCYGFPDQVRGYYQNTGFLSDFELRFEEMCARLYYLGPLREYPKRQYTWAGARPADMGRQGERVVDALLASREEDMLIARGRGRRRQTLEQRVAEWLKELGLIEQFEVRPITPGSQLFQVWVRRHRAAKEVLITDVGFGVSQILPVITLCYYAPPGSTLLLEQPEIHLHPAVQAGLADVFVDAIKTRDIQVILESHSEHLLRRLQRRVAEERLTKGDAALYFCAVDKGESRLTPLDLDEFGTIRNWPPGFFGDEFDEIAATSRAALVRKHLAAAE